MKFGEIEQKSVFFHEKSFFFVFLGFSMKKCFGDYIFSTEKLCFLTENPLKSAENRISLNLKLSIFRAENGSNPWKKTILARIVLKLLRFCSKKYRKFRIFHEKIGKFLFFEKKALKRRKSLKFQKRKYQNFSIKN